MCTKMVICSSQDAPSLACLYHRKLLNTPFPSMPQDTSKQKSNNYKLQCCALPMSDFWSCAITLLGTFQHTTEERNQCLWWRHITTCSWNATQNPHEVKMTKFKIWKSPVYPIVNCSDKPQQNYQEKLHPGLAFTMKG